MIKKGRIDHSDLFCLFLKHYKGNQMNRLYTPWRESYATSADDTKQTNAPADNCVFCSQIAENNDAHNWILRRFNYSFVILNKFPYNAGHLLILPLKHTAHLEDLSKEVRTEIMEVTALSCAIIKEQTKAEGINVGINLGKAAGAGIPSHLHVHVLPRWQGDTNFLPALANTKIISFDLQKIYADLKTKFAVAENP
jgi:ATP adenylyltransferase